MERYNVIVSDGAPDPMLPNSAGLWVKHGHAQREIEMLEQDVRDYQRKYYEAMDIMSAWKNIDHAEAVARMLVAEKRVKELEAR